MTLFVDNATFGRGIESLFVCGVKRFVGKLLRCEMTTNVYYKSVFDVPQRCFKFNSAER